MSRLKVRHRTITKGDYRIVVNYVKKTGAFIDAALYRENHCVSVTDDLDTVHSWMETAT